MNVATFRKSKGWTQGDLARRLGLRSKGYISAVESGRTPVSLKMAILLEEISGGQLTVSGLRPDAAAPVSPP